MGRNLRHAKAAPQGLYDHLLFDGRDILLKSELFKDLSFYRPEAILAFAQDDAEPLIDAGGNERTAHKPETLVECPVKFA